MSRRGQGVLIMAGGTGGHIFPGLAVARELIEDGVNVRWLGARGGMECQQVPQANIPLDVVDISGLRGKGARQWLSLPWRLLRAVSQAFRLLGQHRPSCAISFGGYAAGPGGLAAKLRGIPLLVHEQNRIPGMTNRYLSRMSSKVLQAFPGTWEDKLQAITCGNPVRRSVVEIAPPGQRLGEHSGPVRILLTGGSQGALALNRLLPAALGLLAETHEFEVRHQAGRRWAGDTREAYQAAGVQADVSEFIDDMAAAYAWADLVLCRAGALTVSEVAAAGVAALFVPFPHAVDDHQTRNAEFLVEHGAAALLHESGLDEKQLSDKLAELMSDRALLHDMAVRARRQAVPDAASRVAGMCSEYTS